MEPRENERYIVDWNGLERQVVVKALKSVFDQPQEETATSRDREQQEAYCHFIGADSRLDEWIPVSRFLRAAGEAPEDSGIATPEASTSQKPYEGKNGEALNGHTTSSMKRKREPEVHSPAMVPALTAYRDNPTTSLLPRTVSSVLFGSYEIKCWYSSPYPIEDPTNAPVSASSKGKQAATPFPTSMQVAEESHSERSLSASAEPPGATPLVDGAVPAPVIVAATAQAQSGIVYPRSNHGRFAKGGGRGRSRGRPRGKVRGRGRGRGAVTNGGARAQTPLNEPLYLPMPSPSISDWASSPLPPSPFAHEAMPPPSFEPSGSQAGSSAVPSQSEVPMAGVPVGGHAFSNGAPGTALAASTSVQAEDYGSLDPFDMSSYSMDTYAPPLRLNGGSLGGERMEHEDNQGEGDMDYGDLTDSTEADDSMQAASMYENGSGVIEDATNTVPHERPSTANQTLHHSDSMERSTSNGTAGQRSFEVPVVPAPASKGKKEKHVGPVRLHVCEGCFKYMVSAPSYAMHTKTCQTTRPPGKAVYQRGVHTIWEVDGESAKLYCQNLCLFGKLFIDHKYVFFETSGFLFYVLTEARPKFDHPLGFFSKEKISYNDYNLACIVTFPPYQKRGFGSLMIEFSYELSRRSAYSRRAGTPERPLSDLGLRGYLQFWTSVLVRYFRLIFYTRDDPRLVILSEFSAGENKKATAKKHRYHGWQGEVQKADMEGEALLNKACETPATASLSIPVPAEAAAVVAVDVAKQAGPEGGTEMERQGSNGTSVDDTLTQVEPFEMRFSLAEIANATHLREDDVAFAMVHSGLAKFRTHVAVADTDGSGSVTAGELELVIAPAMVEEVATRMKVKSPVMSRVHCLL